MEQIIRDELPSVTTKSIECDDAISRDAACKMICAEFVDTQDGMSEWRNAVNDVVEEILHKVEHLPSVTQKSGKWILQPSNKEQGERDFIWWKCSECGHVIYSETEKDRREYHAFCGRCGARMDEPQESEDKE